MRRELLKTASYAVLHFTVGFTVSYAFTGNLVIAGGIALVEPIANTIVYFFHEQAWRCGPGRSTGRSAETGRAMA